VSPTPSGATFRIAEVCRSASIIPIGQGGFSRVVPFPGRQSSAAYRRQIENMFPFLAATPEIKVDSHGDPPPLFGKREKIMPKIKFPENLWEMLENWEDCSEENVGWCLLCDRPIRSETDMIPETNFHSCPEGIRFNRSVR
jgi:hypothetical protein